MPPKGAKKGKGQPVKIHVEEKPKQVVCPACVVNAVLQTEESPDEQDEEGDLELPPQTKRWINLLFLANAARAHLINVNRVQEFIEREYEQASYSKMPVIKQLMELDGRGFYRTG